MVDIKECVERMAEIKKEIDNLKSEYNNLEAKILLKYTEDTKDTKHKAVSYAANAGNIIAAEADSVKVIYPTMLKEIFGVVYPDMVKEETTYTLTSAAKSLIAAIYKQEYITDKSFEEAVNELPITDEKSRKALKKKLKGRKYDSDKKILMEIGGLPEKDAGDYAYMLSEVANWNDFWNMLNLNGKTSTEDTQHIIDYINSAVTVETTPKVSLKVIEQ